MTSSVSCLCRSIPIPVRTEKGISRIHLNSKFEWLISLGVASSRRFSGCEQSKVTGWFLSKAAQPLSPTRRSHHAALSALWLPFGTSSRYEIRIFIMYVQSELPKLGTYSLHTISGHWSQMTFPEMHLTEIYSDYSHSAMPPGSILSILPQMLFLYFNTCPIYSLKPGKIICIGVVLSSLLHSYYSCFQ